MHEEKCKTLNTKFEQPFFNGESKVYYFSLVSANLMHAIAP